MQLNDERKPPLTTYRARRLVLLGVRAVNGHVPLLVAVEALHLTVQPNVPNTEQNQNHMHVTCHDVIGVFTMYYGDQFQ